MTAKYKSWRSGRVKNLLFPVGKGKRAASEGKDSGAYPFYTSSQVDRYSDEWDFDGTYLLVGDGGVVNSRAVNGRFGASDHSIVYQATPHADARFCDYWIQSSSDQIFAQAFSGVGIKNLNRDRFAALSLAVPPLETQKRISDFLHGETAKIDALVTELTGFVKLLKARDKSLVAECVTQGVPHRRAGRAMKDSGVDWIGEIPEEWTTPHLKRVTSMSYGDTVGENQDPNGSFLVCGSNGAFDSASVANTKGPVIVVGRKGSAGKVQKFESAIYATDTTYFIDSRNTVGRLAWLVYLLSALPMDRHIGNVGVPGLSRESLYREYVPFPPSEEQQEIAVYLDEELGQSKELQGELENQVNLLKTYRKSLISEVVTGKIEV